MSETLVTVRNVSKKFCRRLKHALWYGVRDLAAELTTRRNGAAALRTHEFWALRDVSLELERGQTLGLIGPNGAGKTTLLRLLNGLIKPDEGRIEVRGRMQALIALGAGFNPVLTGRENIYVNAAILGIPKCEVNRKLDEIVAFSGVEEFIDAPVQSYSSGMVVRLGFAVAAHMRPDILLVDEVLAVGDEGFQAKCLNKIGAMRQNGAATVLVSHNMHMIGAFAQHALLLQKSEHAYFTNVSQAIAEYRRSFAQTNYEDVKTIVSGSQSIQFYDVKLNKFRLEPLDSVHLRLKYETEVDIPHAEIDLTMYTNGGRTQYFQATNKAYREDIHLRKGTHDLTIQISHVPIQNAQVVMGVAIWRRGRTELLFWRRIPLEFTSVEHSNGQNFLRVTYES